MARRRRTILFPLAEDASLYLRARFDTDKGSVVGFAIQIEKMIGDERAIILRFDTSHGYVHHHSFAEGSPQARTRLRFANWEEAYTYCYEYAKANWPTELERYMRSTP